jgi:hypothetical protein
MVLQDTTFSAKRPVSRAKFYAPQGRGTMAGAIKGVRIVPE